MREAIYPHFRTGDPVRYILVGKGIPNIYDCQWYCTVEEWLAGVFE